MQNVAETRSRESAVRFGSVLVMALALSVKGDGTFPLPSSTPVLTVQVVTLVLGASFALALLAFARPRWWVERLPLPSGISPSVTGLVCSGFAVISAAILQASSIHYAGFGYRSNPTAVGIDLFVSLTMIAMWYWRSRRPLPLVLVASGSSLLYATFSISHFPLSPARSDMLPLITSAFQRMAAGLDPYVTYPDLASVPLTYLPGLWGAFVPGLWLGLDPRWTHYAGLVVAVLLLLYATPPSRQGTVAPLLAMFVMTPYLIYRHEIYAGIFWLTLVLTFVALARRRFLLGGAALGWSFSAYPFSWALGPLVFIAVKQRYGWRALRRLTAAAICVSAILVGPFLITSPRFYDCVIGYWLGKSNFSGFNLGFWLLPLVGLVGLRVLQLLALVGVCFVAVMRRPDVASLAILGAGLLFCIFSLNPVVWVYFDPAVIVLLLAAVCLAEHQGRDIPG